jgi:hypothetical protein
MRQNLFSKIKRICPSLKFPSTGLLLQSSSRRGMTEIGRVTIGLLRATDFGLANASEGVGVGVVKML